MQEAVERLYGERERQVGPELFHRLERWILLGLRWEDGEFRGIDQLWKDHLLNMDHLKEGIGLRGYGQHDPLVEYKRESFDMFEDMMEKSQQDAVRYLFHMQIMEAPTQQPAVAVDESNGEQPQQLEHGDESGRSLSGAGARRTRPDQSLR